MSFRTLSATVLVGLGMGLVAPKTSAGGGPGEAHGSRARERARIVNLVEGASEAVFAGPEPEYAGLPCETDEDCDDLVYCNGAETCDPATGECRPGSDPCERY